MADISDKIPLDDHSDTIVRYFSSYQPRLRAKYHRIASELRMLLGYLHFNFDLTGELGVGIKECTTKPNFNSQNTTLAVDSGLLRVTAGLLSAALEKLPEREELTLPKLGKLHVYNAKSGQFPDLDRLNAPNLRVLELDHAMNSYNKRLLTSKFPKLEHLTMCDTSQVVVNSKLKTVTVNVTSSRLKDTTLLYHRPDPFRVRPQLTIVRETTKGIMLYK